MKNKGAAALILILGISLLLPSGARAQTITFDLSLDAAPAVSSISISSLTYNSAVITWQTNKPADTQAEYGLNSSYGSNTTLDPALTMSHTATISGLSPVTAYHFRVLSADASGFLQPSADQTFTTLGLTTINNTNTTTNTTDTTTNTTTNNTAITNTTNTTIGTNTTATIDTGTTANVQNTGGGGGGGGGGFSSSVPVDTVTLEASSLLPYVPVSLAVPYNFPIKQVTLQSASTVSSVKVSVKKINTANVPDPPGALYKFMRIDGTNTGGLNYIETEFDVPRSWAEANGYTADKVKLLRYTDKWEELPTYETSENSTTYSFRAVLPGFSVFAIVAANNLVPVAEEKEENITANESGLEPLVSPESEFPINVQFFVISGVMFLMALLLYLFYHHRHGKKKYEATSPFVSVYEVGQN